MTETKTLMARRYVCGECGAIEDGPIVGRSAGVMTSLGSSLGPLPPGWERYTHSDPFTHVVCGACVGAAIAALLERLR